MPALSKKVVTIPTATAIKKVSAFEGKRLIARHREINGLAAEALQGPVHALALHTYTPTEWEARGGQSMVSPNCLGGSKHDQ